MFGTYRFFLAALVALSHFGVQYGGFNPGQWAVVSFYTLSGLLMERQHRKLGVAANFYLDRFLRIYPVYLAVVLLAVFGRHLSWGGKLANIALLPLNYSEFTGIPMLINPAWSLACEVHFYLLVPLLVLCSTKTLRIIVLSSLAFFCVSPFLPHASYWAYTGLPGILFTFLSGMLINRKDFFFLKRLWVVAALLLVACIGGKLVHAGLPTGIHINVCLGYLAAVIVVSYLDRFSPKAKWDRISGLFSYPLFLCHGLAGELVQKYFSVSNPLVLLAASVGFAAVLIVIIEIPFDRIRYAVRKTPVSSAGTESQTKPGPKRSVGMS